MSVHEGNTLVTIARVLPSGERTKSATPVAKLVTCMASGDGQTEDLRLGVDARAEEIEIAAVGRPAWRSVRAMVDKGQLLGLTPCGGHPPEIRGRAVFRK